LTYISASRLGSNLDDTRGRRTDGRWGHPSLDLQEETALLAEVKCFQDALAVNRRFGKPDLFITSLFLSRARGFLKIL
jgi:hypothetical protein